MTTTRHKSQATDRKARALQSAAVLLPCLVVLVAMRLHGFDLPLETDECNYAYIGARLLEGSRLYVDVWDHQPFGVFALFGAVIAVFGDDPVVFRWMVVAFSFVLTVLVFALLRQAGGYFAAAVGAALFAVVSSDPGTGGEGCNREIYMNTFILLAWYLAIATPLRRPASLTLAGLSLGIGSVIKTVVAVHWLGLALWIVILARRDDSRLGRWIDLCLFGVGPAAVWLATTIYFGATGRLDAFVDAVFLFNLGYSEAETGALGRCLLFFTPKRHPFIFDSAWPLWWAGAAATVWLAVHAATRLAVAPRGREGNVNSRDAAAVFLLVIASFVAVCLPGRFWPHYYYLMLPPLVIAVALAASTLARASAAAGGGRAAVCTMRALLFISVVVPVLAAQYRHYLSRDLLEITINRYNSRDFWGRGQGRNVRSVTEPDDRIFVYSNDASIYYYAKRRCASRYTMITGLSGDLPGAAMRRRILMQELRADPPRLVLVLFEEPPFPEWQAFLRAHYGEPIGWDYHDKTGKAIMFVLCRKDQPVREIDWNWDRSMIDEIGGR